MRVAAQEQDAQDLYRRSFKANPDSVRTELQALRLWLIHVGCSEESCGTVELVFAEILNNITKHAYSDNQEGLAEIELRLSQGCLCCRIVDGGREMPSGKVPNGSLPSTDVSFEDLPEGGFGWFLLKSLAEDVTYARRGGKNHLTLTIPVDGDLA